MTRILGIDPGTTETAYALICLEKKEILSTNKSSNEHIRMHLPELVRRTEYIAIEMVANYGMCAGASLFHTCIAIGRFIEIINKSTEIEPMLIFRKSVVTEICGRPTANDKNVRQAMIDYYGEQGRKATPGPTYGISNDMWAALAVATAYREMLLRI